MMTTAASWLTGRAAIRAAASRRQQSHPPERGGSPPGTERNQHDVIQIPEHRNEAGDEVDRRERTAGRAKHQPLREPRRARIARRDQPSVLPAFTAGSDNATRRHSTALCHSRVLKVTLP